LTRNDNTQGERKRKEGEERRFYYRALEELLWLKNTTS
jgi:hypothetical protein